MDVNLRAAACGGCLQSEFGRARVKEQGADSREKIKESMQTCPVDCIHWVSGPQLVLLNEAMAKTKRVCGHPLIL